MPETELPPTEGRPAGSLETNALKPEQPPQPQTSQDAWLTVLQGVLSWPFMDLLKHYLEESNGNPRRTTTQCVSDFRHAHPFWFWLFFGLDSLLKLFYVGVAVVIALRGLGLLKI